MINWDQLKQILLNTTNPVHTGPCEASGQITMVSDGVSQIEIRPELDQARTIAPGKPTRVSRGVYRGFSLPIYAADEDLFFDICVPQRWNGTSDITVHVHGWLDTANTDKKFQLCIDWEHITVGTDVVPNTSNTVPVETSTGTAAQYKTFEVSFVIDYNIDGGDDIAYDDDLAFRLYRIAATGDEIAGEFVVKHAGVIFQRDKMGAAVP